MISYYCCNSGTLYVNVMTYNNAGISQERNNDPTLPHFNGLYIYIWETQNPARFYPLPCITNPRLATLHYAASGQISVYII